jgi:hypothetical protein
MFHFAGVDLLLQADYRGRGRGWYFQGRTGANQDIPIGALIDGLVKTFGVGAELPKAITGSTIHTLGVSFNTATRAFTFTGATAVEVAPGKRLDISVLIDIDPSEAGYRKSIRGRVKLGAKELDLILDERPGEHRFVASSRDGAREELNLGDLIAAVSNDATLIAAGRPFTFQIKDALFAWEKRGDQPARFILGADVGGGIDLSGLPLVGGALPQTQALRMSFQPLFASEALDVEAVRSLVALVPVGGLALPDKPLAKGVSLSTTLQMGNESMALTLGEPAKLDQQQGKLTPPTPPAEGVWVDVQRDFGPLHVERIGVRGGRPDGLAFLLDASLEAAGLTLTLSGLSATISAADFKAGRFNPSFELLGVGVDYRGGGMIEIGGSLLRTGVSAYEGSVVLKTRALSLTALGSYREIEGRPSLFVGAILDQPLGGPSFFFVTGLVAAFGYNRALLIPPIEELAQFPLIADSSLAPTASGVSRYTRPEIGAVFLGVGLSFSTFKLIKSSALLIASFGEHFELDLIGRSTLSAPAQISGATTPPLSFVEMAWRASFRPEEGVLDVRAQLTPSSYVFHPDCHISGGFAFCSWFAGEHGHEGDFVLTLGGYHPAFRKPPHYPTVPRLALRWQVEPRLLLKGEAYCALTGSGLMAGGLLEMAWQSDHLRASFRAGIDFLVAFQPYLYDARAHVEVAVSYTFEFFGTHTITTELSADIHVWGPPFAGTANLDLHLFSVDITFGPQEPRLPEGLSWEKFRASCLPEKKDLASVSITGGLVRSTNEVSVVSPKDLVLVTNCVIPSKDASFGGIDQVKQWNSNFGVAPMTATSSSFKSKQFVTIKRGEVAVERDFHVRPVKKRFPTGLWGESLSPTLNAKAFIEDALAGFTITPARAPDKGASVRKDQLELFQYHRPTLQPGPYTVEVCEDLEILGERPSLPPAKRTFVVAGERFALPPSQVHAVYPPEGSLGESSNVLPHIVLTPSTWPWERRANPGTAATPWLALLLFNEGEAPKPHVVTVGTLQESGVKLRFSGAEDGEADDDKVTVIDVPWKVLREILPTASDLELLTHVRQVVIAGDEKGPERAVVVGNRCPKPGGRSTVHLVSVENRYPGGVFDAQQAGDEDRIRLVSLFSWSFSSLADKLSFNGLLSRLNSEAPESFRSLVAHSQRDGRETQSEYRGPLLVSRPAQRPDSRDDLSYRVAKELGRVLALQSKQISAALVQSHQVQAQHQKRVEQRQVARYNHLYTTREAGPLPPLPDLIDAWLRDLVWLKGIPLRYLIPDEELLPRESIRFFWVDPLWLNRLVAGALSLGQVPGRPRFSGFDGKGAVVGALLRSSVVAGWPGLIVEPLLLGRKITKKPGYVLKTERIAKDIILVLSSFEFTGLEVSTAPETLHFGVEDLNDVPWRVPGKRVINAEALRKQPQDTSAQIAAQRLQVVTPVTLSWPPRLA